MCAKRMKMANDLVDKTRSYTLEEAVNIIESYKDSHSAKFNESVDIVLKLGINPKQTDQMVRGVVKLKNGLGKSIRVLVFTNNLEMYKDCGADIIGGEELIEEVKAGKSDFDVCVATPDIMIKVSAALGKVLGPKGKMPNPKTGTVTNDVATTVKELKAGRVEFKSEKGGLVHASVGRINFSKHDLKENVVDLFQGVLAAKPATSKGTYLVGVFITTTMGMSIPLDTQSIVI